MTAPTEFSAADSALGYLYQVRLALLSALQRIRAGEDFLLTLETLDDVAFERDGEPPVLLQTKHHRKGRSDLTDASRDIWKTLRIWCEGLKDGAIPQSSSLYLVTTSTAPSGSAASYLRLQDRDPEKAHERLAATARTSGSQENQPAYRAFFSLDEKARKAMLAAAFVVDAAPSIVDLGGELKREVRWAVERDHTDPFLSRLEGWWFRRAIGQLSAHASDPVLSREIEAQMDDLREQFKRDALPIDPDILRARVDESAYADAVFVKQLQLIGVGAPRVLAAIREYFRAFTQRSRWLRERLVYVGELDDYARRLVEEWQLVFERIKDDLDEKAAEVAKKRAAREVYAWVENAVIPIRPNVTEPFVTRGSYHLLADRLRVGWHPEFMARLQHLLEVEEVGA